LIQKENKYFHDALRHTATALFPYNILSIKTNSTERNSQPCNQPQEAASEATQCLLTDSAYCHSSEINSPTRFQPHPALITDWNWYNSHLKACEMMLCSADC
jgi:hypothetical protein